MNTAARRQRTNQTTNERTSDVSSRARVECQWYCCTFHDPVGSVAHISIGIRTVRVVEELQEEEDDHHGPHGTVENERGQMQAARHLDVVQGVIDLHPNRDSANAHHAVIGMSGQVPARDQREGHGGVQKHQHQGVHRQKDEGRTEVEENIRGVVHIDDLLVQQRR